MNSIPINLKLVIFKIYTYYYLLYLNICKNSYLLFIFFTSHFYDTYLVKNNKIIKRISFKNLHKFNDYDYFVNWHIISDSILYNINSSLLREKIQKSEYQFLLIYLFVDNKKYDLTDIIQSKNTCYLSMSNKLFDKNFFNWINIYLYQNKLNSYNYYFTILDRNIQTITISNSEYIILEKNNYIIKN